MDNLINAAGIRFREGRRHRLAAAAVDAAKGAFLPTSSHATVKVTGHDSFVFALTKGKRRPPPDRDGREYPAPGHRAGRRRPQLKCRCRAGRNRSAGVGRRSRDEGRRTTVTFPAGTFGTNARST